MIGIRIDPARLILERSRRGFSQAALADRAGLAYLTVSRIERGKSGAVQAVTAYKLSRALGLDVEYLMRTRPRPQPSKVARPTAAIRRACPQGVRRTKQIG